MAEKAEYQNNKTGEKYEMEPKEFDGFIQKFPQYKGAFTQTRPSTTPPEARKAQEKKDEK